MDNSKENNKVINSTGSDYLEQLRNSTGSNRDTKGLGIMTSGFFFVGRVDANKGKTGEEVPEFVATRHELIQLARYWTLEGIEHDFDWFMYQSTGSSEWRWSVYIDRRLSRLSEILGPDAMRQAHEDAIASFRKRYPKITDEDWRVFTQGTPEEQEAWRDKLFGDEFSQPADEKGRASI
jgi:hypothetical protein